MAEEIFHVITKSWMSDVSCDIYNFLNFSAVRDFFLLGNQPLFSQNKSADIFTRLQGWLKATKGIHLGLGF